MLSDNSRVPVGTVREIWRYPVKSMAGERLEHSDVGWHGLRGDRGWAVCSEDTGQIHNAKMMRRAAASSCDFGMLAPGPVRTCAKAR